MAKSNFKTVIESGYQFEGNSFVVGAAMLDGKSEAGLQVKIPLKTLNRHGLIAGATGTGKTKSLQMLAENLAANGTSCLLMDIKGDLSGIAAAGTTNEKLEQRAQLMNLKFEPNTFSTEFLTLSNERGARLRATVTEFGPVLFSKILGLNDTQSSVVSVVFKFCDDSALPLLDLEDFKRVLSYFMNEGKDDTQAKYGNISPMTIGTILRRVIELEQQDAAIFFGEKSFDVNDLCRFDGEGRGVISVVRLADIQSKPKLFSTFMLQLLAEIYQTFPEAGDIEQPKLVVFIDEAHLVFAEASKNLLDQIETIIKLIRSKGVGVIFCTQNPNDIPDAVLGQLGLKIQHALRAFTAKDRQAIRLAAQNYPISEFYDAETLLTSLGIGEALVTALNEKGVPTPLVHSLMRPPATRMDVLSDAELNAIVNASPLVKKYDEVINRDSAAEILTKKMMGEDGNTPPPSTSAKKGAKEEKSVVETILTSSPIKQMGNTVIREVTRGLLGILKRKFF